MLWYALSDSAYSTWQTNFATETAKYDSELDLTAPDIEAITSTGDDYIASLQALQEAKAAYEAAVMNKNDAKQASIDLNRTYVAKFQAITGLSNDIFQALQIPARGTQGTKGPALEPSNLIATTTPSGKVTLKYSRNGNSNTTVFTVQQSTNSGATWSNVYSSNRTRVTLNGYTPGNMVWFRVFATRNNTSSNPTTPVMIWPTEGAGELIAIAA